MWNVPWWKNVVRQTTLTVIWLFTTVHVICCFVWVYLLCCCFSNVWMCWHIFWQNWYVAQILDALDPRFICSDHKCFHAFKHFQFVTFHFCSETSTKNIQWFKKTHCLCFGWCSTQDRTFFEGLVLVSTKNFTQINTIAPNNSRYITYN